MAVVGRLYTNRKETAQKEKQYTKQYKKIQKHRTYNTENKNTRQKQT